MSTLILRHISYSQIFKSNRKNVVKLKKAPKNLDGKTGGDIPQKNWNSIERGFYKEESTNTWSTFIYFCFLSTFIFSQQYVLKYNKMHLTFVVVTTYFENG